MADGLPLFVPHPDRHGEFRVPDQTLATSSSLLNVATIPEIRAPRQQPDL